MGKVTGLFIAAKPGDPMRTVEAVRAFFNLGLEGDRYHYGRKHGDEVCHGVTLFSEEAHTKANAALIHRGIGPYGPHEIRRNIMIAGIEDMTVLVGKDFSVGSVRMRGIEPCEPCMRPARLLERGDGALFMINFAGRAGIRAQVLTDGEIRLEDEVRGA
ncbi:MAG TPA: MOSC domain-containing protein [Candidatus Paceibacterota bacterium]|nr:MOSC domain-containing protein [Candidatus Paceibacterota bacterium]